MGWSSGQHRAPALKEPSSPRPFRAWRPARPPPGQEMGQGPSNEAYGLSSQVAQVDRASGPWIPDSRNGPGSQNRGATGRRDGTREEPGKDARQARTRVTKALFLLQQKQSLLEVPPLPMMLTRIKTPLKSCLSVSWGRRAAARARGTLLASPPPASPRKETAGPSALSPPVSAQAV